jgi:hypothetical protein
MHDFHEQLCHSLKDSDIAGNDWIDHFHLYHNTDWKTVPTYPKEFFIPKRILDNNSEQPVFETASKFRTKCRVPILCMITKNHPKHGAKPHSPLPFLAVWRSSQPKPGLWGARCHEDEYYLQLLGNLNCPDIDQYKTFASGYSTDPEVTKAFTTKNLYVMDLRSGSATFGNKISGNGGESNNKAYKNIIFNNLDLDNIHGISKSFD